MPDQRVSNERKKELEQLDPFQENLLKTMAAAKKYQTQLFLVAGAIVIVITVLSGVMYSFKKAEEKASELVSQVLTRYEKATKPLAGYDAVKEDFQKIFSAYANTASGKLARVKFAKICYDAAKFGQSYEGYKSSLDVYKNDPAMRNFLLMSLGHVSLERGNVKEAQSYFEKVEKGKSDLLKDEAQFAMAMLYEASNNSAESEKLYEKIATAYEDSMYQDIALSKTSMLR